MDALSLLYDPDNLKWLFAEFMWVRSGREYGLCSSVSLWLGQCIAVHHRGEKIQRIPDFKFTHSK